MVAMLVVTTAFSGDYQIEFQPRALEQAVRIEQKGVLKQKDNGYLYIEVSNDFIGQILPLIDAPGKIVPLSYYTGKKGIGAHISVMYENEQIENEIWEIRELGCEFTFTVMELRTVKLIKDGRMKKLWLIAVDAPGLESLRQSYGLPPKIKGHDFHITLGTQVPGQSKAAPEKEREAA